MSSPVINAAHDFVKPDHSTVDNRSSTLRSRPAAQHSRVLVALATAWLLIVVLTVWRHEFWRDEVRAFSIAIAAPSLTDLPRFLKDEGHPIVWYALLHIAYAAVHSPLVLPIVSVAIAGAALLVFLFRSPFPLVIKILFTFSILPLYEYAVMARNYGISMLLMFVFAALYPQRRRHPLLIALSLALLANTNVHSLVLAGLLTLVWLWDEAVVERRALSEVQRRAILGGCGLVAVAALLAVITMLPDKNTLVLGVPHPSLGSAVSRALTRPWLALELVLPPWGLVSELAAHRWQDLLIVGLFIGLIRKPTLAVALLIAVVSFGVMFQVIYGGAVRHQGLLLIFALTLYWLLLDQRPLSSRRPGVARLQSIGLGIVLPVILLWGDYGAFNSVRTDWSAQLSSVKSLASWIKQRPDYASAILIGEPAYLLEALPYYSSATIYIPREYRFGNWTRFTTAATPVMSLQQLLDTAQQLKMSQGRRVLIVLGFPAAEFDHQTSAKFDYNKLLTWSPSQWQQFEQQTTHIAGFWQSRGEENFDLYEVR